MVSPLKIALQARASPAVEGGSGDRVESGDSGMEHHVGWGRQVRPWPLRAGRIGALVSHADFHAQALTAAEGT